MSMNQYLFWFLAVVIFSFLLTLLFRKIAFYFKIIDYPDKNRKIHDRPIPLLGGMAIFISFLTAIFILMPKLLSGDLNFYHWFSVILGGLILMIGGFLDDKYNLKARWQIIFPILAAILPILGGVSIDKLSIPAGGIISVSSLFSMALIVIWLLGMMYTTKLLDGVDGLVSGLGAIGALVIFLFTSTTQYAQADIALAALLFAGACLGFLILNFHPAKIFLGEGGSLLIGYVLGVLAIISGGKIAIALLIMALPILDVAWTIIRRLYQKKNPFKFADRDHLHHRLLKIGLSPRQTSLVFYSFAIIFGLSGLFLQSRGKLLALISLLIIMSALIVFFSWWEKNYRPRLLLHVCCAPCASYITQKILLSRFRVIWYFYNPNLSSLEEYNRRLAAAQRAAKIVGVKLIAAPCRHEEWRDLIRGRELDSEKGIRCQICYRERIVSVYNLAKEMKCNYFSTSLLSSPYKDDKIIREIGQSLSEKSGPRFLNEDFQKNNGFKKSLDWAREHNIYLQRYCGCEFSYRKA
jgi:UDP-GlcNAc:undecaprenyl-phosphate/decaprenyl-phosphate GlcNAc-1-phosphate transferase